MNNYLFYNFLSLNKTSNLLQEINNRLTNRHLLHKYLQPFCREQLKNRRYTAANTVALFAQPRSGSTWLAEILQAIPRSIILNEPLWRSPLNTCGALPAPSAGRVDEVRKLNFYFNQPIPEPAGWPAAESFFDKLLKGGVCKLGLYDLNDFKQLKPAQNFIVKFCYGHLLFHWFLARFNVQPIVLIRHPCAVVSSQLRHYAWKSVHRAPFFQIPGFRYHEYFLQYEEVLKHIHTAEGVLAAIWAINTKAIEEPHQHNRPWHTLVYEKLLLHKEEEIPALFHWINQVPPPGIYKRSEQLSSTSSEISKRTLGKPDHSIHLNKWKKDLNQRQIANIMHIVKDIGVDYYSTDELEPDYTKLYLNK